RLGLLARVPGREMDARREARGDRGGHVRHPAADRLPAPARTVTRDLRALFEPSSVAVLGASNDPLKYGNWLARGALEGEHRRSVYLVNRAGGEVLGRPAFRSLADLPAPAELVAVAVPAASFEQAVEDSLEAGARALVAITAGLGESGPEGA